MSAPSVYRQTRQWLTYFVSPQVDESSRERLFLLVVGILRAESVAPAAVARALATLAFSPASTESLERRVRRMENDPELQAPLCLHPLVRHYLRQVPSGRLILILDPTTKADQVVKVSVNLWYNQRTLPLAWTSWPANVPLQGARFWQRIAALLAQVASLLPPGVPVIWLADRAFGSPAFTDLLRPYGWHYVVRVQGQTRCQASNGQVTAVKELVAPGGRAKLVGQVFKKQGWRTASVVVRWEAAYQEPLCVVSDLPCHWALVALYRRRFAIEPSFRHEKSCGWHLEQCQVRDLDHLERLLVGMALASWLTLLVGSQQLALSTTQCPSQAQRLQRKYSLFSIGLHCLQRLISGAQEMRLQWRLCWQAEDPEIAALTLAASAPPG